MVSGNLDLFDAGRDFLIEAEHENFPATGLSRASYVFGGYGAEVPASTLEKKRGELVGRLLEEFRLWWGFRPS